MSLKLKVSIISISWIRNEFLGELNFEKRRKIKELLPCGVRPIELQGDKTSENSFYFQQRSFLFGAQPR